MDSISFVSCDLMLVVSLISAEYNLFMADFDLEVKYSLYTINSKDTETPSVKPWRCRTTLCEQGSLQALEKRLKATVSLSLTNTRGQFCCFYCFYREK